MELIPITQEGYEKLLKEHEQLLKVEMPAVITKVMEARALGDLKENAEYHAAREYQGMLQGRINFLSDRIARCHIVKKDPAITDAISFASKVKVIDLSDDSIEEYTLVGQPEADPAKGRISTASPIGKSLLGKKRGDIITIQTPGGKIQLKVIDFS